MNYETVIGLEVHIQLNTNSKIFCSCSTDVMSLPNSNICPVCCGYPGVLPVFNKRALELAIRVSLALNCKINKRIYFERKNYFYPDLPKNYQISQYKLPLGEKGFLELSSGKKIDITRVHLEEDAGKLIHKEEYSLIDLNRTGIPLLEIVSEPDISTPEEAFEYLTLLKLIIQYIEASTCDMEKGYLRCDANVSIREQDTKELGVKVELKNMNSFRGVRDGLTYEVQRQIKCKDSDKKIFQETRLWNDNEKKTSIMRTKEEAHDYRYFPEPDLVDFIIEDSMIDVQRPKVVELPLAKKKRFILDYSLGEKETDTLISDLFLDNFFENSLKTFNDPKNISNWILGPLLESINSLDKGKNDIKISSENFSKIVKYFVEGKLNNLGAKKLLATCINANEDVDQAIENQGLVQVSNEDELGKFVKETISANPKPVQDFLAGNDKAIMFLVGQVMKKTKGRANPKVVKELFQRRIKQ